MVVSKGLRLSKKQVGKIGYKMISYIYVVGDEDSSSKGAQAVAVVDSEHDEKMATPSPEAPIIWEMKSMSSLQVQIYGHATSSPSSR